MGANRGTIPAKALAVGLLAAGLLALVGPNSTAAREFRAADIQSEEYPTVQALKYMDRYIAERSGGRHRIRVFHSRQLGEESQTIEQTRIGAIDINRINVAALGSFAPEINVLALPFLFDSPDHLYRIVDGSVGQDILAALGQHGFVGLAFYDSGARSLYTSTHAVRTPSDLVSLRIRVQQSDLMQGMVRALGAQPVVLPFGQVMTALSAGLIDGAENNWPSFVAAGHYRVARFYTPTEHAMPPEVVVMSRPAWEALSPEDQKLFRAAAQESSKVMRGQWLAWEVRARQQAADAGVSVVEDFDRPAFQQAAKPLVDRALADPRLAPLIERIQAAR